MSTQTTEFFDTLAKVLLRCLIYGLLLLPLWISFFILARDTIWAFGMRYSMFALNMHELSLIHYGGTAFISLSVILFFLVPWIAIRRVLRKGKGSIN